MKLNAAELFESLYYQEAKNRSQACYNKGVQDCERRLTAALAAPPTESLAKAKQLLHEIRTDTSTWKAPRAGGQDQYAGLPPAIRRLDEAIQLLGGMDEK